jgi:hypothetical protein
MIPCRSARRCYKTPYRADGHIQADTFTDRATSESICSSGCPDFAGHGVLWRNLLHVRSITPIPVGVETKPRHKVTISDNSVLELSLLQNRLSENTRRFIALFCVAQHPRYERVRERRAFSADMKSAAINDEVPI